MLKINSDVGSTCPIVFSPEYIGGRQAKTFF